METGYSSETAERCRRLATTPVGAILAVVAPDPARYQPDALPGRTVLRRRDPGTAARGSPVRDRRPRPPERLAGGRSPVTEVGRVIVIEWELDPESAARFAAKVAAVMGGDGRKAACDTSVGETEGRHMAPTCAEFSTGVSSLRPVVPFGDALAQPIRSTYLSPTRSGGSSAHPSAPRSAGRFLGHRGLWRRHFGLHDLAVGDCFNDDPASTEVVQTVTTVRCAGAPRREIFFPSSR